MRGLTPEAMVLEEIRQKKLVTPEEYLLIQTYIQTRTDHTSASQIRDIHEAFQQGQISETTYQDTKAKLITRIRKEVKTREIAPLAPEEEPEKPRSRPLPLLALLAVGLVVLGLWVSGVFGVPDTVSARTVSQLVEQPSGTLPMESFRQPDGTYSFDYPVTTLGQNSHMVWFSSQKWWLRIENPQIEAADLGRAREVSSGLWKVQSKLGTLYVAEGSTGMHIRSEVFQQELAGMP
ncbi:hypothetical protein [Deinococcus roseus]|uniref:Anti-sigma factor n=1 Tax=Deinococcus roseus TaxID=392414 RepID=A0ABQ2CY62_9DEIO|nr:hypothetical protein [Deinococcus roseus]GGJ32474.1 hypothetical protein GCM10008938_18370 [Deinococcus roseus]